MERLRHYAALRPRFGYKRLHVLLRREGWAVNHKRIYRMYLDEKLALRKRRRRRVAAHARVSLAQATKANQRWSMDFVADTLASGLKYRTLNVVDDFRRECLAFEVDRSIGGARVCRVLDQIADERGGPEAITIDNGSEFISRALDNWAYKHTVQLRFIRPGKPIENAYVESFNGRLRDECLNQNWFTNLADARQIIEGWRIDQRGAITQLAGKFHAERVFNSSGTRIETGPRSGRTSLARNY